MLCKVIGAAALTLAVVSIGPAAAQRPVWVKTGVLNCDVSGGWGWIIGSQKSVQCLFTPDVPGRPEYYVGTISKFGLDIGATARSQMVWVVYAETLGGFASLAGNYGGATGEATGVVGLGANVLIGGSNRTVALQPLSITGQVGLNVAAGVAELALRPGR
jgi:Protein of unknown function (DUF992)